MLLIVKFKIPKENFVKYIGRQTLRISNETNFLHQFVLEVDEDVGFFPVRLDQSVESVAIWHPTDKPRVHRKGNHR